MAARAVIGESAAASSVTTMAPVASSRLRRTNALIVAGVGSRNEEVESILAQVGCFES
jgi:hypothetical protein